MLLGFNKFSCHYTGLISTIDGLEETAIATATTAISALEIVAEAKTVPAEQRQLQYKAMEVVDPRPHAVCTVQTFRNAQTGKITLSLLHMHTNTYVHTSTTTCINTYIYMYTYMPLLLVLLYLHTLLPLHIATSLLGYYTDQ